MIGKKIRDIRKSKNITIVELSERISVTSGYISQIERDLISPSLSVLKRLAEALEVPLSILFLDESRENVVTISKNDRTKVKFGNLNVDLEFVTPIKKNNDSESNLGAEIFLFNLPPKAEVSEEPILIDSKVCLHVLKGMLECNVGGKTYKVTEGDTITIPENNGHTVCNCSDEATEAICYLSPAHFS